MKKTNYIQPILEQLNYNMEQTCNMFMLIGSPSETPRYYNFKSFDDGILTIGSTQKDGLFFKIDTNFKFIDVNNFWQQFKEYRTNFLLENYPTINIY